MKNFLTIVFVFGLVIFAQGAFSATATSTLSWQPPTERVDGTPFSMEDIQEYRVYYTIDGTPPGDGEPIVVGGTAVSETVTLELTPRLEPYVVSFAIKTVDTDGLGSALSEVVTKEFEVESTSEPGAPTNLQFEITCGEGCTIKKKLME